MLDAKERAMESSCSRQQELEAGIAALEAQRAVLGDAIVDALLRPAREKLADLQAEAASHGSQKLRQVTILFLDVVGSTTLSQHLDPEDVGAVMDGFLSRGTAVVGAHGGRVLQYAGDNILAAFGADRSAEDDAERAVRCGLALLELGRTLGAEVLGAFGHAGVDVRVGIHTASVLLGGGVDDAGSIRGLGVNIAARLEQTAPPSSVQISQDTLGFVRGLFEVEPRPAQLVKGLDAPLICFLVRRANVGSLRDATRGIEGVETQMVGRANELAVLQRAFERLHTQTGPALVHVVADAGLGKSRLLAEFVRWISGRPERALLLRGTTTPQTLSRPFGLLCDLMTRALGIAADDTLTDMRARFQQQIATLFADEQPDRAEGHAHLLGHLFGLDWQDSPHLRGVLQDPKQIRSRAFHVAGQVLLRLARREGCPALLLIEDLHWADGESLEFLDGLVEFDRGEALLVVGFTRPLLFERAAGWRDSGGARERIDLHPLDANQSHALASELLKRMPEIPTELHELLTNGAEGNPFYMEELVRMLIDKGTITTGRTWSFDAEALPATHVPATLVGVLQSRLDGLPAAELLALQQASIIGPVFTDRALLALDLEARSALPGLVRRGLLVCDPQGAEEGRTCEYAFRHHILCTVTYGTVLRPARRAGHASLARWLVANAEHADGRHGDLFGTAADHFERAGEVADAVEFHARAAEHAVARFAHAAVLEHVRRALSLLEVSTVDAAAVQAPIRWRLLLAREQSNRLTARRAEQSADLATLGALADTLALDSAHAELARRRAGLAQTLADWPTAERETREAMRLADRLGDPAGRLAAQVVLALALRGQGRLADAQALAERALAESRERGLKQREWSFLRALALIYETQGCEMKSAEMELLAMAIARETGDRVGEAIGLDCMGQVAIYVGDLPKAQSSFEEALQLQDQLGLRSAQAHTLVYLAAVLLWQGDEARALEVASRALQAALSTQHRYAQAWAHYRCGEAALSLGLHAQAAQAMAAAVEAAQTLNVGLVHAAMAGRASVALAQGALSEALQHVAPLLAQPLPLGIVPDTTFHPELVALTCHEVLRAVGDRRAEEWLARAHALMHAVANGVGDQRDSHLRAMPHRRRIDSAWQTRLGASS